MERVRDAPAGVRRHEEIERLYRAQGSRMWRALLAFAGDADVASDAVAEAVAPWSMWVLDYEGTVSRVALG